MPPLDTDFPRRDAGSVGLGQPAGKRAGSEMENGGERARCSGY